MSKFHRMVEMWSVELQDSVQSHEFVSTRCPSIACVFGGKGPSCVRLHGACLLALTLDALNLPLWGDPIREGSLD